MELEQDCPRDSNRLQKQLAISQSSEATSDHPENGAKRNWPRLANIPAVSPERTISSLEEQVRVDPGGRDGWIRPWLAWTAAMIHSSFQRHATACIVTAPGGVITGRVAVAVASHSGKGFSSSALVLRSISMPVKISRSARNGPVSDAGMHVGKISSPQAPCT